MRLNLVSLEDRLVPAGRPLPYPVLFAGAESGSIPVVKAYDAESGHLNFEVKAYESAFTGGVRVAAADVNRDTYPDVVVAPGPGGGPRVRVLDGKTGEQIAGPLGNFFAFEEDFTGGLSVAGADVNGDGVPDVIVAAGQGGGPRVRVFSGQDGTVLADFYAFEADFRGGVTVAAADVTGDGRAELVVGAGPGGGPRVRVLDVIAIDETATARERTLNATDGAATARERAEPATASLPSRRQDPTPVPGALGDFFAFPADRRTGVTVGTDAKAGDVTGDGVPDLLVGSGPGAAPTVQVYSGADGTLVSQFSVFDPNYDPSYGKIYTDLQDFQNTALSGFYIIANKAPDPNFPNTKARAMLMRKPGNNLEIKESLYKDIGPNWNNLDATWAAPGPYPFDP
jgi:hypothetical protein